jgi:hypothetical protein
MALSKKGLRKLKHHGVVFGWTIRSKPTYSQAAFADRMTLAVQSMNTESSTILHVTLSMSRPDNWISPHQTQITPKVIRNIIDMALKSGWQYDAGGKAYELEYTILKNV